MDDNHESLVGRHEAVFSVFMAAVAFLSQFHGSLDHALLGLFGALMAVNLAASRALRAWPSRRWLSAAISLSNCGVVAAIVERSGGPDSVFWVLYLLPIFSSCLLLGGRETVAISAGAALLNAAGAMPTFGVWSAEHAVGLAIKTAVLVLAATVTQRLAQAARAAADKLNREREQTRELEMLTRAQRVRLDRTAGLADAGLIGAGVAHDLNNALMVIAGYADVALDSPELPASVRADVAAIRRSAAMARRIAASMLGLTRKVCVAPEPLALNELAKDVLDMLRVSLQGASVRVELRLDPELPRVVASRTQLQRVLLNLVSNAARALSETGGALTISSRCVDARGGRQVVLAVEDDGPGLPAAVLATLFQPFTQGGAAEGHGLGLYLCWEMARDNGGRLHGGNKPEGGARFELFLPTAESASPAVEREQAGAATAA